MFGLQNWALALTAALSVVHQTVARPTEVHPGTAKDIVMTSHDTINGTINGIFNTPSAGNSTGASLKITVTNNIASGLTCYVTGQDPNKNKAPVMLQSDGSWYYPTSTGEVGIPQPITADIAIPMNDKGQTTDITIPGYLVSARIWFAVGNLQFFATSNADGTYSITQPSETNTADPSAGVNWGFVEFDYEEKSGIYANISYVDFVGIPLGMTLTNSTGGVQTALGLPATAVNSICGDLKTQAAKDGKPWDKLCQSINGTTLRVLSPYSFMSVPTNTGFSDYFDDYVDKVWDHYSSTGLTLLPQNGLPNVTCTVSGDTLGCPGDNKNYTKPSTADIFGCSSGPFTVDQAVDSPIHIAAVPRLCAAFNRGTFLLDGGDVQPSLGAKYYYTNDISNFYSKIVHKYEVDGKGYAFSYDDINPDGNENASGSVTSTTPTLMTVTVGGPTQ
ncbi:hypothetical protein PISL3812_03074 [Talaromyces islandicus]|uniref:GH64 domain-containing protein n=1 Tax=Talaromyces islandicus TaxID=28573 RepID=A0A0U1LTY5_TALIS|nr:hypothetical protein PISL3812_03074 [Talaromyces islandicus]